MKAAANAPPDLVAQANVYLGRIERQTARLKWQAAVTTGLLQAAVRIGREVEALP